MTDGRLQLSPLPDEYDVLHFPEFDFAIPSTEERFRARLVELFPAEAEAIDRFFRTTRRAMAGLAARNVFASFPAGVRRIGESIVERLVPSTYRSVWDQVTRSVRDPRLRAVLAARWGLYGTAPRSSAFGYHAAVPLTFFMDGTAHPVGGPRRSVASSWRPSRTTMWCCARGSGSPRSLSNTAGSPVSTSRTPPLDGATASGRTPLSARPVCATRTR